MNKSILQHRTPIALTAVGIILATGLASAPLLMAESDAEILAATNAADISTLTSSIAETSSDIQNELVAQANLIARKTSDLENQIQILNKAASRLHLRQRKLQDPTGPILASLTKLEQNADGRMINLEKAVSQLHRRQRTLSDTVQTPAENSQASQSGLNKQADARMIILEKAVSRLHKRQMDITSLYRDAPKANDEAKIDPNALSTENTLPNLERFIGDLDQQNARIDRLELGISQLRLAQNSINSDVSEERSTPTADIRRRIEVDIRIRRLEEGLRRLGNRLEDVKNAGNHQDAVVDQLFDIRNTVDILLNEIAR